MAASRKKRGISRDVMTRSGDPFVGGGGGNERGTVEIQAAGRR